MVLILLYRILGDIARGTPFAERNVGRLRLIALTIAGGWSFARALEVFVTLPLLDGADLGGLPVVATWMLPVVPVGIGMVVALLAEAFKVGSAMADDLDGLV